MDNPLLIAGIASVVIVIGFILAAIFREKKKPPVDFNVDPPF